MVRFSSTVSLIYLFFTTIQLKHVHCFTNPSTRHTSTILKPSPSTTTIRSTTSLFAKSGTKKKKVKDGTITVNRLAYRNYEIVEKLEAGISLTGTEVKSIRDGKMNIRDGYVRPTRNGRGCTLHNVHIGKHSQSSEYFNHEETRVRVLLVHKREALKWMQQVERQGMTIVPLKAYFNEQNKVKFQIALVKGKNVRDKRHAIRDREGKREAQRMIKNFRV